MIAWQDIEDNYSTDKIEEVKSVDCNGIEISVKQYLPIVDKASLINDVLKAAMDGNTNTFSPLRLEVYFTLYVIKYYAGIDIPIDQASDVYDLLEVNGLTDKIVMAIPQREYELLETLVDDTVEDIIKYNYSMAGMLGSMSQDANQLEKSMKDIFDKIKNEGGKEALELVKNMGGTD